MVIKATVRDGMDWEKAKLWACLMGRDNMLRTLRMYGRNKLRAAQASRQMDVESTGSKRDKLDKLIRKMVRMGSGVRRVGRHEVRRVDRNVVRSKNYGNRGHAAA